MNICNITALWTSTATRSLLTGCKCHYMTLFSLIYKIRGALFQSCYGMLLQAAAPHTFNLRNYCNVFSVKH